MPPEAGESDDLVKAAEAEAAAALARAEAARERAAELRRALEAAHPEADSADSPPRPDDPQGHSRLFRPQTVLRSLAVLLISGLLAVGAYLLSQHRSAAAENRLRAEFSAAARQGVVNLMSMDANNPEETVRRVIDESTGKFKANFEDTSNDLIKAMRDAKVVTRVTVNDTAVESMANDSGVVLVAATSEREGGTSSKNTEPRQWRVLVTLQRDGGRLKIADVAMP